MRRGETLDDRVPDIKGLIEEYFGEITGTESYEGHELFVIEQPDNPAFSRVVAGPLRYSSKKDKLALHLEEADPAELIESGDLEAAGEALSLKNDFLERVTGRDAKARRESMKRSVEDSPDEAPEA